MQSNSLKKVAAILTLVTLAGSALAQVIDGPIFNPATGHLYYLLAPSTWTTAESEAVSLGGTLATVNDIAENAWIFSTFSSYGGQNRNLWIGLYTTNPDGSVASSYGWADGENALYRNWTSTPVQQPFEPSEQYTEMIGPGLGGVSGQWNNLPDGVASDGYFGSTVLPNDGVVEVVPVPEPASGILVLAGLAAWIAGRRFRSLAR